MLSPFFTFMNFYMFNVNDVYRLNFILYTQIVCFLFLFIFFLIFVYRRKEVHNFFFTNVFKEVYIAIYDIILGSISNNGIIFFPFLFFFWFFIFFFNLIGLFPFSFTIGSHFSVTICFSLISWLASLILIIESKGLQYFDHFFPSSVNFYLGTFISVIEVLSFVFRAVSLALRLFANLVAGHVLLHLCAGLVVNSLLWYSSINIFYIIEAAILLFIFFFLFCFELVVAFIQSYVFLLLTCIYFQDTLNSYPKNSYYYSTQYLVSKNYLLYTNLYEDKKYKSILFNDTFSPQNIKYRFLSPYQSYKNSFVLYEYFNKESYFNQELATKSYRYDLELAVSK